MAVFLIFDMVSPGDGPVRKPDASMVLMVKIRFTPSRSTRDDEMRNEIGESRLSFAGLPKELRVSDTNLLALRLGRYVVVVVPTTRQVDLSTCAIGPAESRALKCRNMAFSRRGLPMRIGPIEPGRPVAPRY